MTCKDCIHYEVCKVHGMKVDEDQYKKEYCGEFELSRRFIEMPVPLGKPVYVISKCHCSASYEPKCQGAPNTKYLQSYRRSDLKRGKNDNFVYCYKIYKRPFGVHMLRQIGNTVFITLEEAERVASGR